LLSVTTPSEPATQDVDPTPSAAAADAEARAIASDVEALYGRLLVAVVWTLTVGVGFCLALLPHLPSRSLWLWASAIAVVQLLRLALLLAYRRSSRREQDALRWSRAFTTATFAAGLAWAVGPLLMLADTDSAGRGVLLLCLIGVTAVGVIQLASSWPALTAFASGTLAPPALLMLNIGGGIEAVTGLGLLLVWGMVLLSGRSAWRTHRALVVTQWRLADSLAASDAARAEAAAASARAELERRLLAHVVDATSLGIAEWYPDEDRVVVNDRFARMLGHEPAELHTLTGADWLDLVHAEDRDLVMRRVGEYLASGNRDSVEVEMRMCHRAGRMVWVLVRAQVVRHHDDGRPALLTGSYLDVTERKLEAQRWQARAELSADWFWEADERLRVTYLSQGHRDGVLPFRSEEVEGRTLAEAGRMRPVEGGWAAFAAKASQKVAFNNFLVKLSGIDGQPDGFIELDGRPRYDVTGRFVGFEGTGRNVTEKVRTLNRLRESLALVDALFDTVPLAIAQMDIRGRLVRSNPAFQSLFGRTAASLPDDVNTLVDEVSAGRHREADQALLAAPGQTRYELRQRLDTGQVIDTLVHKATLLDDEGRIVGLVATLVDISEQKTAAQALAAARDAAEQANRAKSFFLATMSHELRTPLNAVIGAAQLLRSVGSDAARRLSLIEAIEKSGTSLLGLIENVMDLSRIEAGALKLSDEPFDLLEAVESAVATAAVAARNKGVAMACVVQPELAARRQGDPLRLRQLVLNLLGNAVKFTPAGEVVVRVCGDDAGVRIEVADTGVGIPPHALPRIFDRFSQADQGATRRFGGSGLGLAIVHELVQAMGGRIEVESRVDAGTRFKLWLPLRALTWAAPWEASEERVAPSSLVGVPVAWYEPHPSSASALQAYLSRLGCQPVVRCETPGDLREFLATFGEHGWFLCSSDGPDATEMIEATSDVLDPCQVIGMSAGSSYAEEAARDAIGLRRTLLKPVLRSTLVSRMAGAGAQPDFERHDDADDALDLPDAAQGRPATAGGRGGPATSGRQPATVRRARLLLVEDDPTNRLIVGAMLESDGHEVDVAVDGHGALQALACTAYDLVLMDWQMPDMDGLTVTRRLRAGDAGPHGTRVPIVALTANAFAEDRLACLQAGMNDFLTKPVQVDHLLVTVGRWVMPRVGGTRPAALAATRPAPLGPVPARGAAGRLVGTG
jgi:PAS domain S-box-containing protein